MKLEGIKVNILGDSITFGVNASSEDKIYHALLKKETGINVVRNYGLSGTRYAVQRDTLLLPKNDDDNQSFCERFHEMDDDADLIIVFGGTNDYKHGTAPLGTFEDRTPHTFYGACHYLYSNLIKKYLGKPIVIMTPLHRTDEREIPHFKDGGCYGILLDYVNAIREVAQFYSLPVLDLYRQSGLQPEISEIKEKYIPDGLHPNDEGNRVIADKLKKFLEIL